MKIRPKIVVGDLVRFSKKGKRYLAGDILPKNCHMIVKEIVSGNGMDRDSMIKCKFGNEIFAILRRSLWKTGFNILENESPYEITLDQNAPINNNGRGTCYLCHMPTKKMKAFLNECNLCKNPNCKWYEN